MLKLNNVNSFYGDMHALRDVSLEIEEGKIISIVGSNGAGKSTLINVISGIIPCASGEIEYQGTRIDNIKTSKIVSSGIVQIPEGRLLFPYMSVLENLELGAFNATARKDMKRSLEEVFDIYPMLKERSSQLAGTLSGGQQQMVAIARGLMARPKLLMMDEPSLGLAPLIVKEVFETIEKINNRGISVLLVEQNVYKALSISHKAYVLENGRVTIEGNGDELLANPVVKEAYLGI